MSRNFPNYDETTAPEAARPILSASRRTFGQVPAPLSRYASSPLMLQTTLANLEAFEHSSLSPLEQEVVAMTLGHENACQLCLSMHGRRVQKLAKPEVTEALTQRKAVPDARLEALRRFVLNALERRGAVDAAEFDEFLAQGFDRRQALDVMLGVSTYTLTTFANHLTETSKV